MSQLDHDRLLQRQRPDKLVGDAVRVYLEIADETGEAPDVVAFSDMFGGLRGSVARRIRTALATRRRGDRRQVP
jgi:hypothetical protein